MRIALMQTRPETGTVLDALEHLSEVAAEASAAGAELIVTPEMFLSGYNVDRARLESAAVDVAVHVRETLSDLARSLDIAIAVGLPDRAPGGGITNSAWLVDGSGQVVLRYDKTHLFGDLDRSLFVPGKALSPVASLDAREEGAVSVSLAICYDIEFPELVRAAALAGSQIILCPTANMVPYYGVSTGTVPKRAEESGLAIAYANYCGSEGGLTYCGNSVIAAPWGSIVVAGPRTESALLVADVPGRRPDNVPTPAPYMADRRPDLYGSLTSDAVTAGAAGSHDEDV